MTRTPWSVKVYPRVYGGTGCAGSAAWISEGLSPRVRGNHLPRFGRASPRGSIPACTGEPLASRVRTCRVWVYPRVYGGTQGARVRGDVQEGLSPRVRGNPDSRQRQTSHGRSIPACTGEPIRAEKQVKMSGVYPRVYGGTPVSGPSMDAWTGLSPRVRGNPWECSDAETRSRSIPACTGEPRGSQSSHCCIRVYPRVYGGTRPDAPSQLSTQGLSPRVRGNHGPDVPAIADIGSIPACTGEPLPIDGRIGPGTVYPRVYGGTAWCHKLKF